MPERKKLPVIVKLNQANITFWTRITIAALGGVLLLILIVGLRPHASYSNEWLSFNSEQRFTAFQQYGLATGSLTPHTGLAISESSLIISMEVELREASDDRFQVLAQIDSPGSLDPLIIGQWRSTLIVMSGRDYRNSNKSPRLLADLSAYTHSFAQIDLVFSAAMTELKVNGLILKVGPVYTFDAPPTRISIGNSPDGTHGWAGNLKQFELLSTAKDPTHVRYRFNLDNLPRIGSKGNSKQYLTIPEPGRFPDRGWLGVLQIDQLFQHNLRDAIVNFLGFLPLGLLIPVAVYLRRYAQPEIKPLTIWAVCGATVFGVLLSLAIETLQIFIAGRSPHIHDLLLNSLGTAAGALSIYFLFKIGLVAIVDDGAKDMVNDAAEQENH